MTSNREKFLLVFATITLLALIGAIWFNTAKAAEVREATVTWTNPTERVNGTPLTIEEIARTEIFHHSNSVDPSCVPTGPVDGNYNNCGQSVQIVAPPNEEATFSVGLTTWYFRARTCDVDSICSELSPEAVLETEQNVVPPAAMTSLVVTQAGSPPPVGPDPGWSVPEEFIWFISKFDDKAVQEVPVTAYPSVSWNKNLPYAGTAPVAGDEGIPSRTGDHVFRHEVRYCDRDRLFGR